ncbi:MAG TPA: bifunctional phosphopantothenoylcysteine decarboxylase/phosphopantothenate--cysteine ligase CoaBC [Vicinamibacterales bacterium]|nr:bifunctional phosphopantothenoylcysteine decarboxylase/phosphopantothenate--cysteine ligase CoaBC [Vicinamibacterales bacterium]
MSLIALGVSGGIGAYKAVEVVRALQQRGHDVVAIMTRNARRFVAPLTFEAITRHRVISSQWTPGLNADIEHISIATDIDLLIVAPATANILGKLANGIADDFLSTLYLATRAPVLVAPAMNTRMLEHEAVQRNLTKLASRGVHFVEPSEGYLACGWMGKGRLADPAVIAEAAEQILRPTQSLTGRRVLVSAGPTYEDLDPVRFVGNRSSGKMGFALAEEAARRGAAVTIVAGPTRVDPPPGPSVVRVRSAAEMRDAVLQHAEGADLVIMAAAVADYTPVAGAAAGKLPREGEVLTLELRKTPDILGELGRRRGAEHLPVLIGFAAETGDPSARAREKLLSKRIDLIIANDVSRSDRGFDVDMNAATMISAVGDEALPLQTKRDLARAILDRAEALLNAAATARASAPHADFRG